MITSLSELSDHAVEECLNSLIDKVVVQDKENEQFKSEIGRVTSEKEVVVASVPIADNSSDEFWMKTINFFGQPKRIVMQSANGPCPLIAAINALVLKGTLSIPARERTQPTITRRDLTELIGTRLLTPPSNIHQNHVRDYEKTLSDLLNILPQLGNGLEVNLSFRNVSTFEYTTSIALFDLLGLNLYHTWVVEKDSEYYDAVGTMTYNQITAAATENVVLRDFLDETSSQMTYSGLFDLRDTLKNGEIAVLFRNNHFHTLMKNTNELFVLCTDVGFLDQKTVVWEVLQNIEGDSCWANEEFRVPTDSSASAVQPPQPPPASVDVDVDRQLAERLQAEWNISDSAPSHHRGAQQPQPRYDSGPSYDPRSRSPPLPAHLRYSPSAHHPHPAESKKNKCVIM